MGWDRDPWETACGPRTLSACGPRVGYVLTQQDCPWNVHAHHTGVLTASCSLDCGRDGFAFVYFWILGHVWLCSGLTLGSALGDHSRDLTGNQEIGTWRGRSPHADGGRGP